MTKTDNDCRACQCCGWRVPDALIEFVADCPECGAHVEMLANDYVGYRVTALGLLEASPTRH